MCNSNNDCPNDNTNEYIGFFLTNRSEIDYTLIDN